MHEHTAPVLDMNMNHDEIAAKVLECVQTEIFKTFFLPRLDQLLDLGARDDEILEQDELADDETLKDIFDSEEKSLEAHASLYPPSRRTPSKSKGEPNKIAADEQWNEAVDAINLGMRAVALKHLRRAVELRVLDDVASYWTARLLVVGGNHAQCTEAMDHAQRAARIFEAAIKEDSSASTREKRCCAAAAWLLAAFAARRAENPEGGLRFARLALKRAPWRSEPSIELVTLYAFCREWAQARKHAQDAFLKYPPSILRLNSDPVFRKNPVEYKRLKDEIRKRIERDVEKIFQAGRFLDLPVDSERLNRASLLGLVRIGRRAALQCYNSLVDQANSLNQSVWTVAQEEDALLIIIKYLWSVITRSVITSRNRKQALREKLRADIAFFRTSIEKTEGVMLQNQIYSPTAGRLSAVVGDLIRLNIKNLESEENLVVQRELLPKHVMQAAKLEIDEEPVSLGHELFRVILNTDSKRVVNRSAAYFNTREDQYFQLLARGRYNPPTTSPVKATPQEEARRRSSRATNRPIATDP